MLKLINADMLKITKSKSFMLIFIVPILMSIIGLINIYRGLVHESSIWNSIYNQTMILYAGLTLPLAISVIISLQWKIEYDKNNILNLCSVPQSLISIYMSKILSTLAAVFINILIIIAVLLVSAHILNPAEPFKLYLIYGPLTAFVCCIPFVCLQHLLSILNKNYIFSISIGILLTLFGFILAGTPLGIMLPSNYMFAGCLNNTPFAHCSYTSSLLIIIPVLSAALIYLVSDIFKKKDF